ncbi:chain length determinant protein EpsF [Ferribacterium limneticum]|uniref:chain length determinant protein EpsF n=1 Tax=Ferribacterium limneticum TaxID=76259 RepID=UPI001CF958EF|nr:chain length determinant protein EpsF [Ferribacterium limneticum]UCV17245.1 chain length determinant protein EpsF [Ferribacterium limneticum]
MTFQQFLLILWARRKLALSIFGVTVLTTLVISLMLPKEYTATTSLVVDVKSPDPINGMLLQAMITPGYMATQIDIINSDRVATRVVKLLGFEKSADAVEKWKEASEGKGTLESYYAAILQKKLDIKPSRESNVINVNFSGSDPTFAAAVANAFAQAYIDTSIEMRVEPARQYSAWFEERQKGLRAALEKAQSRLSAYQQEKGIVVTDDRMMDNETARLNDLTMQLSAAQAQRADASSRQKSGTSELSLEVLQNPLIQGLKAEIARAESQLSQIGSNFGKNHPQVQQLEAQIVEQRQQLREEIGRISGGAAVANKFGAVKQDELKKAIEEQKKRVLDLRSQRDELSVLVNDVETARRAYEAVGQRMTQSNLEGQSQQTNVLVLSPATEPTQHSRPKVFLNVLVSIFLGTLLGVGAALVLELSQRRIRSAEDLSLALDLPVLAELDSALPKAKRGFRFWAKNPVDRGNREPALNTGNQPATAKA